MQQTHQFRVMVDPLLNYIITLLQYVSVITFIVISMCDAYASVFCNGYTSKGRYAFSNIWLTVDSINGSRRQIVKII